MKSRNESQLVNLAHLSRQPIWVKSMGKNFFIIGKPFNFIDVSGYLEIISLTLCQLFIVKCICTFNIFHAFQWCKHFIFLNISKVKTQMNMDGELDGSKIDFLSFKWCNFVCQWKESDKLRSAPWSHQIDVIWGIISHPWNDDQTECRTSKSSSNQHRPSQSPQSRVAVENRHWTIPNKFQMSHKFCTRTDRAPIYCISNGRICNYN